jgi:hypothetical protein
MNDLNNKSGVTYSVLIAEAVYRMVVGVERILRRPAA